MPQDPNSPAGTGPRDLAVETFQIVKKIESRLLGDIETGAPGLIEITRNHGQSIGHIHERLENHSLRLHDYGNQLTKLQASQTMQQLEDKERQLAALQSGAFDWGREAKKALVSWGVPLLALAVLALVAKIALARAHL